jgi:hypothetical protein
MPEIVIPDIFFFRQEVRIKALKPIVLLPCEVTPDKCIKLFITLGNSIRGDCIK